MNVHAVLVDPVEALNRLGGVATTSALLALTSRRSLRTAVAKGSIRRVGRNRYSILVPDQARRAAAALNGYASHLTAAQLHGWEVRAAPRRPQIVVPRHRPLPKSRVAEVRRHDLSARDVEGWTTTPLTTVVMCAMDLPFADALAVADSALRHKDIDPCELAQAVQGLRGERGTRARRVASYADGRAANPFESALRAIAIETGLSVVPQYEIVARGLTLHPDLELAVERATRRSA